VKGIQKVKNYKTVLTIAGSDSSGGAGIQADIKTLAALGCYGVSVITAVTAQNTQGVMTVHPVPSYIVTQQLEAVLKDIRIDVVKIGMLYSAEIIEAVTTTLRKYSIKPIVLDPIIHSTSGTPLLEENAIDALKKYLIPRSTLITPNIPEAEALLGIKLKSRTNLEKAAENLAKSGCQNVLLKGGHLSGDSISDIFYSSKEKKMRVFTSSRIKTVNTHGTGCTLSSAIAAYLAREFSMEESIQKARQFTFEALKAGVQYKLGPGKGPLHHFYAFWKE